MVDTLLQLNPATCDGKAPSVNFIAEEKLDGHRALLHCSQHLERAYLTSRRISKKTGLLAENGLCVPHIINSAANFAKSNQYGYTVLDGEILIPGYKFEDVQSVLGALPATALDWQCENEMAVYAVYDCLYYNGEDIRHRKWGDRQSVRKTVVQQLSHRCPYIISVDSTLHLTRGSAKKLFEHYVSLGGEGLILKDPEGRYGKGWTKWKVEETYDVVITGYQAGQGKFKNMIGAVEFGAYDGDTLIPVGKCSGMSDGLVRWEGGSPNRKGSYLVAEDDIQPEGTRAWFTQGKELLLGTVIEVKCNGLTKHGNLRHPQFVRWRQDKQAEQCVLPKHQKDSHKK